MPLPSLEHALLPAVDEPSFYTAQYLPHTLVGTITNGTWSRREPNVIAVHFQCNCYGFGVTAFCSLCTNQLF